jgi:hypothetical protein
MTVKVVDGEGLGCRTKVQHKLQQRTAGPVGTPRHGRSIAWHLEIYSYVKQKGNEGMQPICRGFLE